VKDQNPKDLAPPGGWPGMVCAAPTLIDHLGPWPLRVVWIVLLAAAAFILAWLPWWLYERINR